MFGAMCNVTRLNRNLGTGEFRLSDQKITMDIQKLQQKFHGLKISVKNRMNQVRELLKNKGSRTKIQLVTDQMVLRLQQLTETHEQLLFHSVLVSEINVIGLADEVEDIKCEVSEHITERLQESDTTLSKTSGVSKQSSVTGSVQENKLPLFDGNALEWPRFRSSFDYIVHGKSFLSDDEKLYYLQSSLRGRAARAIEGMQYNGAYYQEAYDILQRKFGRPDLITNAFLTRLIQMPIVRNQDIEQLSEFSYTLHATVSTLRDYGGQADLGAVSSVRSVVAKLPYYLRESWNKYEESSFPKRLTLVNLDSWLQTEVEMERARSFEAPTNTPNVPNGNQGLHATRAHSRPANFPEINTKPRTVHYTTNNDTGDSQPGQVGQGCQNDEISEFDHAEEDPRICETLYEYDAHLSNEHKITKGVRNKLRGVDGFNSEHSVELHSCSDSVDAPKVTANTASSPEGGPSEVALRVIPTHARRPREEFPLAEDVMLNTMYVDDVLRSECAVDEAMEGRRQITDLFGSDYMTVRECGGNRRDVLDNIPAEQRTDTVVLRGTTLHNTENVGVKLVAENDTSSFDLQSSPKHDIYIKQGPLNILQECWVRGVGGDEKFPPDLQDSSEKQISEIQRVTEIEKPSCFAGKKNETPVRTSLHTMTDVSTLAIGTVSYLRTEYGDGEVEVTFVAAKANVSPVRTVNIPRLELMGMYPEYKLARANSRELRLGSREMYFRTESPDLVHWMRGRSRECKPFVTNCCGEMQQHTLSLSYRHVTGKQNPADLASRGSTLDNLISVNVWRHGPQFSLQEQTYWPGKTALDIQEFVEPTVERHKSGVAHHTSRKLWIRVVWDPGREEIFFVHAAVACNSDGYYDLKLSINAYSDPSSCQQTISRM